MAVTPPSSNSTAGYSGTTRPPTYRERRAQAEAAQAFTQSVSLAEQLTGKTVTEADVTQAVNLLSQMPTNTDHKLATGSTYDQQKNMALSTAQQDASKGESVSQVLADLMWGDQAQSSKKTLYRQWQYMMAQFTKVQEPNFVKVRKDGGSDLGLNDVEEGE